jgi:hypothetical protein
VETLQLNELRAWARRLEERATTDELRAAAKAILMLVDEVEELQAKVVVSDSALKPAVTVDSASATSDGLAAASGASSPGTGKPSLSVRLKRTFGLS